jgi:hypothetical protein
MGVDGRAICGSLGADSWRGVLRGGGLWTGRSRSGRYRLLGECVVGRVRSSGGVRFAGWNAWLSIRDVGCRRRVVTRC